MKLQRPFSSSIIIVVPRAMGIPGAARRAASKRSQMNFSSVSTASTRLQMPLCVFLCLHMLNRNNLHDHKINIDTLLCTRWIIDAMPNTPLSPPSVLLHTTVNFVSLCNVSHGNAVLGIVLGLLYNCISLCFCFLL